MTAYVAGTRAGRTPWHLWVVGVLSLLWSGFAAYDFIMSVTQGESYWRASGMNQAQIDYYNAMPAWMYVPWILGVWGAVLASVLLLLRRRLAVPIFAVSLLGAVVALIYGAVIDKAPPAPPEMAVMTYMPYVIVVIAALLLWYGWAMAKRGVLR